MAAEAPPRRYPAGVPPPAPPPLPPTVRTDADAAGRSDAADDSWFPPPRGWPRGASSARRRSSPPGLLLRPLRMLATEGVWPSRVSERKPCEPTPPPPVRAAAASSLDQPLRPPEDARPPAPAAVPRAWPRGAEAPSPAERRSHATDDDARPPSLDLLSLLRSPPPLPAAAVAAGPATAALAAAGAGGSSPGPPPPPDPLRGGSAAGLSDGSARPRGSPRDADPPPVDPPPSESRPLPPPSAAEDTPTPETLRCDTPRPPPPPPSPLSAPRGALPALVLRGDGALGSPSASPPSDELRPPRAAVNVETGGASCCCCGARSGAKPDSDPPRCRVAESMGAGWPADDADVLSDDDAVPPVWPPDLASGEGAPRIGVLPPAPPEVGCCDETISRTASRSRCRCESSASAAARWAVSLRFFASSTCGTSGQVGGSACRTL